MAEPSSPLLSSQALSLRVGGRTLIERLSLRVQPGQLWCVIGANGSGKTSLLHALAGLLEPDAGSVRLYGRPLASWKPADAACLRGLLPQRLHDAFSASVLDLVLMGRHPHLARWAWEDDADREIALAALRTVDMQALAARDVTTLSGGERQRVGIAALLAQDPLLLLLDEPLAHLDLRHQIMVLDHLGALVRGSGKAVLMSIHDLNLARRFATHALVRGGAGPRLGGVDEVMDEATLSAAFGHPVRRVHAGGHWLFVAA
ncbi:ABC transporter ATP-binding protein [Methylibium sp.]|uniref:ABC transporter ATP-binding protein n=1 Tax=Methylibium sp. TaxID=2067992 RepID=UPI00286A0331|nr:ABC transporter ATP-binding protein [Methylibium sp.]